MPTVSVYLREEIYTHLAKEGKASTIAKKWIEERYEKERKEVREGEAQ